MSRSHVTFVLLCVILLASVAPLALPEPTAHAEPGRTEPIPQPYMVKNINANNAGSSPDCRIATADFMLCLVSDPEHGRELWRSDGTAQGTYLLKDIRPGEDSSYAEAFTAAENGLAVYFRADDGLHGQELWKTDGTAAGTVLVKDINPGTNDAYPEELTALGNTLFFAAAAGEAYELELWMSDGSTAGTKRVQDINPSGSDSPYSLTSMGGILYFAATDGEHGFELWRSDGTGAGTYMVKDTNPIDDNLQRLHYLTAVDNQLFFRLTLGDSDLVSSLWVSDGTSEGTKLVKQINEGGGSSDIRDPVAFKNLLFFEAFDGADRGLWQSDGTPGGTKLVKLVSFSYPVVAGEQLFFLERAGYGGKPFLWRSDGTAAGTIRLDGFSTDSEAGGYLECREALSVAGGRAFACRCDGHGCELWASDGSAAGTGLVKDIAAGAESSLPGPVVAFSDRAYFSAFSRPSDRELWQTDATAAGTLLAVDILTSEDNDSWVGPFGPAVNEAGSVIFQAEDTFAGREMMVTDGTAAGTTLYADLNPGAGSSVDPTLPEPVILANGRILFVARERTGPWGGNDPYEVWAGDGDGKNLAELSSTCGTIQLVAANEVGFFAAERREETTCTGTTWLWRTNGTAAGTELITDAWSLAFFEANAARLFYTSENVLWTLDEAGPAPLQLADYVFAAGIGDEFILFSRHEPGGSAFLWRSDGTAAGTVSVKQVNYVDKIFASGDLFYYLENQADDAGRGLWVTDGTPEGTRRLLSDLPFSAGPRDFTDAGDHVYFYLYNEEESGALWVSDGTPENTAVVKEFDHIGGSAPHSFAAAAGVLFFSYDDGIHGFELWSSEGTESSTSMVADANPAPGEGIEPFNLSARGDMLFFTADDGAHGHELWALDLAAETVSADFDAAPTSGAPPLRVAFRNLSSGPYTRCTWDLGDGITRNTCSDIAHKYQEEGQYTVSLKVSGAGAEDTMSRTDYIVVHAYRGYLPAVAGQ